MFRLMRSMREYDEIPQTFGGELPNEVFSSNARPRLKIGQRYLVQGPGEKEVPAELEQAVVTGTTGYAIFCDIMTGKRWISTFEMTPEELSDYARHPDTFFGVYQRQPKGLQTIMDIYDFFAEGYVNTPKDKLIELLPNYPDQEALQRLSQKELVEIVAERYTYGAISSGFQPETREEVRKKRRGYGHEAVEVAAQKPSTEHSSSENSLT